MCDYKRNIVGAVASRGNGDAELVQAVDPQGGFLFLPEGLLGNRLVKGQDIHGIVGVAELGLMGKQTKDRLLVVDVDPECGLLMHIASVFSDHRQSALGKLLGRQ